MKGTVHTCGCKRVLNKDRNVFHLCSYKKKWRDKIQLPFLFICFGEFNLKHWILSNVLIFRSLVLGLTVYLFRILIIRRTVYIRACLIWHRRCQTTMLELVQRSNSTLYSKNGFNLLIMEFNLLDSNSLKWIQPPYIGFDILKWIWTPYNEFELLIVDLNSL